MFDINPDTHRFYLSDLERTYAEYGRHTAPAGNGGARASQRTAYGAYSIFLRLMRLTTLLKKVRCESPASQC
jgi:hypothetical protein